MKKFNKMLSVVLILLVLSMALSGCGEKGTTPTAESSTSADKKITLKVMFFQAGFGDGWQKWLKEEFEKNHENITIQLVGDAKLMETITPIIESGVDAPDIFMTNGSKWEEWGPQGLVMDLTEFYDEKVPGTDLVLKDYISDAAKDKFFFDLGKNNGGIKKYAVPWSAGPMSVVYNGKLFKEKGLEYPKTWPEFEALCETIKAEGIAPLTYPGKYPNYVKPFMRSWQIQELGPERFVNEFKNPSDPEIYGDPALLTAWEKFDNLFKKGWIMEGTTALDHTQVQMEFINNKVAMILNGYWLEQEMSEAWPEEYEIVMAPIPQDGKIDTPVSFINMPDYISIYSKTAYPEAAKEFLLFSLSPESCEAFAKLAGGLRPFKYDLDNVEVSEFTKSCQDIIRNPNYYQFTDASSNPFMYKTLGNDYLTKIATGEMTPKQVAEAFKKDAATEFEKVKKDLGN
ncbi:ABC transporter substrate-binding protein [Geosporobacter ferrireducens]|uniref:ABC transporter substrate-binding protein n=1 Tax=Geosporobacter ferrireducens TaxID=1424294 RepID=A0A1D8GNF0_9FIRM|nr:extracellular solute-binding protein [Geosporobacter ferrireducens]AOT72448.1 hypothetical protein Gferi_24595 [Geosporobacter ferrireducens]MTI56290.1 extracellular solute-binding protein [Geosporobacter ferrireducens]